MNLELMIKSLKTEKEAIDSAILVLERLAFRNQSRRGRPPAWLQVRRATEEDFLPTAPKAGRKPARKGFSEETKRKMAEAQRKRWAAKRKEEGN
jgi:hypothetical protein